MFEVTDIVHQYTDMSICGCAIWLCWIVHDEMHFSFGFHMNTQSCVCRCASSMHLESRNAGVYLYEWQMLAKRADMVSCCNFTRMFCATIWLLSSRSCRQTSFDGSKHKMIQWTYVNKRILHTGKPLLKYARDTESRLYWCAKIIKVFRWGWSDILGFLGFYTTCFCT